MSKLESSYVYKVDDDLSGVSSQDLDDQKSIASKEIPLYNLVKNTPVYMEFEKIETPGLENCPQSITSSSITLSSRSSAKEINSSSESSSEDLFMQKELKIVQEEFERKKLESQKANQPSSRSSFEWKYDQKENQPSSRSSSGESRSSSGKFDCEEKIRRTKKSSGESSSRSSFKWKYDQKEEQPLSKNSSEGFEIQKAEQPLSETSKEEFDHKDEHSLSEISKPESNLTNKTIFEESESSKPFSQNEFCEELEENGSILTEYSVNSFVSVTEAFEEDLYYNDEYELTREDLPKKSKKRHRKCILL